MSSKRMLWGPCSNDTQTKIHAYTCMCKFAWVCLCVCRGEGKQEKAKGGSQLTWTGSISSSGRSNGNNWSIVEAWSHMVVAMLSNWRQISFWGGSLDAAVVSRWRQGGARGVDGGWVGAGVVVLLCWAVLCCAVLSSVCVCCSLLCRLSFVVWFVLLFCSSSSSVVSRPFCLCYFLASMMLFSLLLFFLLLLLLLAHFKHTQTEAHAQTHTQAWQGGVFCFVVLSLTDNAIFRCTFSPRRTLGLVRCECFNLIQ